MTAASLLSTHFQQLDAFREDHLAVHALGCDETDLTVSGIEPRSSAEPFCRSDRRSSSC